MNKLFKCTFAIAMILLLTGFTNLALAKKNDEQSKKKNGKSFDSVIKDYDKIPGLFTFYENLNEGKVYMEIKPEQFNKLYMCSLTRSAGDGAFYDNGALVGEFPFEFRRVGKKVQMIIKNLNFRVDSTSALSRALERGVSNSIYGVAKIEGEPHKDTKAILVDPTGFFVQDVNNTSYNLGKQRKTEYSFDKDNSYFGTIKSFPYNTEIDAIYHFKTKKPNPAYNLASPYSMFHTYHFSIFELRETGYIPRLADERVGYFQTLYQDYSDLSRETPYIRYVNRWCLEKADPELEVSEPKEPIVYWIENTVPEEYRDYVREGVLSWNKAFEKAGFKDAIVVKQMPDTATWDPADARYSTIRWIIRPGGTYAVGPSHANPFTGQIYDADVRVCADFIRWMFTYSEYYIDPLVAETDLYEELNEFNYNYRYADNFAAELAKDAAFAHSVILSRGDFANVDSVTHEFVRQYIIDLVTHEVGHTLGLRHNFKSSIIHTNDQRHDVERTSKMGITASVMDYNPANIAPPGKKQGEFWNSTPGTYDMWAIEYGYKQFNGMEKPEDELDSLNAIASRAADPLLPYGTDEDVFGNSMQGIDPYCNMRDLGDDPIVFYKDEIALSKELWSKIEEKFEQPGNRYQKLLAAFNRGWRSYYYAARIVPKFIGGIDRVNYHVGDSNDRLPYEPIPAAKQKEAMQFLADYILAPDVFEFPAELLNKLQPERLEDFGWSVGRMKRVDYPIHDRVFSYQKEPVDRLFNPITLQRIQDIQLRYELSEDIYTMAEIFTDLRRAIWREVVAKTNINSFRRRLQRYHLDKDIEMVVNETPGIPEDARTLARNDLKVLQGAIPAALSNPNLDLITRAHLEESKARIDAALKAGVERSLQVKKAK